ncbi:MAG: hypothetical protein D6811_01830 [Alphaproteobacteria bacterium]|nr:MAG: hypothetical protein D6811_01830 [Alphaproteobacteria bacterium]
MAVAPLIPAREAAALALALAALGGCAGDGGAAVGRARLADAPLGEVEYLGLETRLLEDDIVKFLASARGERGREAAIAYAECAAAQYALIRGYGFARHLRTNVYEEAGIWRADAVYTVSPALPEGLRTIDAEVVVANCRDNGIPTV